MAEKAVSPPHQAWEYAADPFAAKKEVEARQTKRKEKEVAREEQAAGGGTGNGGTGGGHHHGGGGGGVQWQTAPEVRMAPGLREMVEGTVRKVGLLMRLSRSMELTAIR
jgi:ATP-dependent RNA helicase DHX57